MKLVFASDSFKGTLSSARICELLEEAALAAWPDAQCVCLPMADGGEGTLDAIARVRAGERTMVSTHDGLMRPLVCPVFTCGDEAFVETAASCGLTLLDPLMHDPLVTTSFGVGECIRHALDMGCTRVTVGLGGSCTNDGGLGMLRALGVRFLGAAGKELDGCGADLEHVAAIDDRGLDPRIRHTAFTIMSDVTNPLYGPNGATYVFGRQKGADDKALAQLEAGMQRFADVICGVRPGIDFDTPGYGAAGGLGMALAVFLNARMESGIETLLQWFDFDALIAGADAVITGEGQLDEQSLQGKVISGVVSHAKAAGVPVVALCGRVALDDEALQRAGLAHVIDTSAGQTLEHALAHAEENYRQAARQLFGRFYTLLDETGKSK